MLQELSRKGVDADGGSGWRVGANHQVVCLTTQMQTSIGGELWRFDTIEIWVVLLVCYGIAVDEVRLPWGWRGHDIEFASSVGIDACGLVTVVGDVAEGVAPCLVGCGEQHVAWLC